MLEKELHQFVSELTTDDLVYLIYRNYLHHTQQKLET